MPPSEDVMPKAINKLISREDAEAAIQKWVSAFSIDFLKPCEYAGEDFQYALAAGYEQDGRWGKRRIFTLTADLDGKVTNVYRAELLKPV